MIKVNLRKISNVIGLKLDVITKLDCEKKIISWASEKLSKKIYLVNVHSAVSSKFDQEFSTIINNSDMALPDGAPIAKMISFLEKNHQERIAGPDLMSSLIPKCEKNNLSIYFYGSTSETLSLIEEYIRKNYPKLKFACQSPPFRVITDKEMEMIIDKINSFKPNLVFVGLGCPKQEIWINDYHNKINSVLIGVGAAFNFYAGNLKRAPLVFRINGFEWLYRLLQEPKRLFFRYLRTNLLFILYIFIQILNKKSK